MKHIITLTGYKNSGKDTGYLYLRQHFTDVCKLAIADEIKNQVAEILGIDKAYIEENKNHPLIRNALQFWGSYRREQNNDMYWINHVTSMISADPKDGTYFITDVRFPSELMELKKVGCVCALRVLREGQINEDLHPSEVMVDKIHVNFFLRNSGNSLKDYERECKWVAQNIKEYFKTYDKNVL